MDWTMVMILVISGLSVGLGFGLIPYLKSKGWLTKDNLNDTAKTLELIAAIAKEIRPNDTVIDKIKKVTSLAVLSAEQFYDAGENDNKKTYAIDLSEKMCVELGLEITDNQKVIIKGLVEAAVGLLPPTDTKTKA